MKKYASFFRVRFLMGLQYRAAALAGVATQFAWGFLEIAAYHAFYTEQPEKFPMSFSELGCYIWLQQAFLALFMVWMLENEIFEKITDGGVAYELCRPVSLYAMWFARSVANRLSRAVLRCLPILLVAFCLPEPYGIRLPERPSTLLLFLLSMGLSLLAVVAFCMIIYMLTFFTMSAMGIRILFASFVELFAGAIVPFPFLPDPVRRVFELLPFGSMQNVPLRVYSGNLAGGELTRALLLQVFWVTVMIAGGLLLSQKGVRRTVLNGG